MPSTQNPYAPPRAELHTTQAPLAESQTLTTIPRVLGTLSIVFGALALAAVVMLVGGGLAFERFRERARSSQPPPANHPKAAASQPTQAPKTGRPSKPVPSVIAGLLLMASFGLGPPTLLLFGIGMLRYRRWARRASIGWAWGVLASLVLATALIAIDKGIEETFALVLLWLFLMPYPIVLLALSGRPRVRQAMCR